MTTSTDTENFPKSSVELDFRDACHLGDKAKLEALVEQMDDNTLDYIMNNDIGFSTGTPVFESVFFSQTEILQYLIELEADIETECELDFYYPIVYKDTGPVLCLAASMGNSVTVEMLLKSAADVMHASKNSSPIHNACIYGFYDIAALLLHYGADPNMKLDNGKTPLHSTCECCDNVWILRLLLAHGAQINSIDNKGLTPLYYACLKGNSEFSEVLLQHYDSELSDTETLEYLWLLGAACISNKLIEDGLKFWKWAAEDERCDHHYQNMIRKSLSSEQIHSGIPLLSFTPDVINEISHHTMHVRFHALVILILTVRNDNKIVLSLYSDLICDVILNAQLTYSLNTLQLITFGRDLMKNSNNILNSCDCLTSIVDDVLNSFENRMFALKDFYDLQQSLYLIMDQLVDCFVCLQCEINQIKTDTSKSVADNLFEVQFDNKQEKLLELLEYIITVSRLIFIFGSEDMATMRFLVPILHVFVRSVKENKQYLESNIWGILLDNQYCRFCLDWIYDLLFPVCNKILIETFIQAGLDLNFRDKFYKTPLHICLQSSSCTETVLQLLIDNGALVDLPDRSYTRPRDIIASKYPKFNLMQYQKLQTLCAEVILKYNVSLVHVPQSLIKFIKYRAPEQ